MAKASESAKALQAWARGSGEASPAVREGAREVIDECRRLREILRVMAEGGLGDGVLFEMLRPTESAALRVVICCGSRDETTLVDAVYSALREVFSRYGADIDPTTEIATGTTAMDPDALAPAVSP